MREKMWGGLTIADRLKVNLDWTLKVHTKVDFPADKVVKLDKEAMTKRLSEWFEASYGLKNKPANTSLCDDAFEITVEKLEYSGQLLMWSLRQG